MRALFLVLVLFPAASLDAAPADGPPSCEAKDMGGALGTFEFKPPGWTGSDKHPDPPGPTTFWIDTDGVDPGTAGCHVETSDRRRPRKRSFGEACLDEKVLVETNPTADKLHLHENDLGHPDKFDCHEWCRWKGHEEGECVWENVEPCGKSARCDCS